MKLPITLAAAGLSLLVAMPAAADEPVQSTASELAPYLQCAPYARRVSGIAIFGDAHTWWEQAEGRYDRGAQPRVGAVMAFAAHGSMQNGHVATVSEIVDSRTVLLNHANWSPIEGQRGRVERGVAAVDVSPDNDWSQVRVWYDPLQALGTKAWPVQGFIYPKKARGKPRIASARGRPAPVRTESSPAFKNAFEGLSN